MKKIFFLFIFSVIYFINAYCAEIANFKVWKANDEIYRVTLDFSQKPEISELNSGNKHILIINFKKSFFPENSELYRIKDKEIDYIKMAQFDRDNVRLVIKTMKEYKTKFFTLNKNSAFPFRVIVDLYRKEVEEEKFIPPVLPTVVIDPGHGGKDPGAIGKTGTQEKDIVLDIAQSIEKELWESGKVNPIITREKDVFVGLKDRVKLTENKNAELFISIHNNAEPTGRARGYRIYILSEDGKADKAEQLAAAKENESFSNFDELKAKVMDKNVLGILYDLKLNQTISQSSKFAHVILEGFRKDFKDIDTQVRRAPFHVLKLAGIPGVLFECGFISNKTDERLLKNRFYREKIAKTIKESVIKYLEEKNLLLCEVQNLYIPDYYEIRPGDTLIKISDKFKMDIESIKKINNIKETSKIFAGKKLKLRI